jgi:quercetin dioxygenase-like cupin family protein
MTFHKMSELPSKEVLPGVLLRSVYIENAMMTFFELQPGSVIPRHKHPHEQISYIANGSLTMTVAGETRVMGQGDIAVIPPNVEHEAVVGDRPTLALDAWYPIREDYVLDRSAG